MYIYIYIHKYIISIACVDSSSGETVLKSLPDESCYSYNFAIDPLQWPSDLLMSPNKQRTNSYLFEFNQHLDSFYLWWTYSTLSNTEWYRYGSTRQRCSYTRPFEHWTTNILYSSHPESVLTESPWYEWCRIPVVHVVNGSITSVSMAVVPVLAFKIVI